MKKKAMPAGHERSVKLKKINLNITCWLCKGYLIDATTVTECLHTFCKSCIVKWLEENNTCPTCEMVIHQSHPLQYIRFDRTMQDIVYKMVPNLQEKETKREREFFRRRGLPYVKSPPPGGGTDEILMNQLAVNDGKDKDYHRKDEQVNVCLQCTKGCQLKGLKKRYIRVSSHATVTHLKKFVSKKLFSTIDKFQDVDILCNEELLGKDHTLKFVCVTRWRFKEPPLLLTYRPKLDIRS